MDTARYVVAVAMIITFPPAFLFWFLIHPLVGFWRRTGLAATYTVNLGIMAAVGTAIYLNRNRLLEIEFGTHAWLVAAGVVMMGVAAGADAYCKRQLKPAILVGVPELRPGSDPGRLLQTGAYAWVRHPRYLAGGLIALSIAMLANYLATWILAAACVPVLYLVTVLEERELVDRFGDDYRAYQQRVPRIIPHSLPRR